jgi:CheY-like chemotaxis protein
VPTHTERSAEWSTVVPSASTSSDAMSEVQAPSRVRLLLVDDEPDMRLMLRLHLGEDPRFEIVGEAADGQEALECCAELGPDVIVLDVRMPRLDGVAALPLLRERCPDAKLALFTAFAETVDGEVVRSHGASLFEKNAPMPWLAEQLFELSQHETT